jgi:chemotaxis protein methyltransferase CheR
MELNLEQTREIVREIYNHYGWNGLNYDISFLQRRLGKFSVVHKCENYPHLRKILLQDETLVETFIDSLCINVSEMFRDEEVFQVLKGEVLPKFSSYDTIKIWSAGCARGQEAYSIAIILKELGIYEKSLIYATDIDPKAIEMAELGKYPINDGLRYSENYYLSGGQKRFSQYLVIDDTKITIKNDLKKNIHFTTHNIIEDSSFNTFDLILCRNMFIYFDKYLQNKGLKTFYDSLSNDGFLVMEKTETINCNDEYYSFQPFDKINRIYTRGTK